MKYNNGLQTSYSIIFSETVITVLHFASVAVEVTIALLILLGGLKCSLLLM